MSIRTAVIGAGYWGKNLLRNLNELGSLVALCDLDADSRSRHAEAYPSAVVYDSVDEVLASPDVDAVAIATPAVTHGEITRKSLLAGKNVFVEKPLCLDVEEARALGKLADEQGRTLMVGHLLLYHPAFLAVKKSVENGDIGRLRYIYSNRASLGKIRKNENALWSFAPHDISMILSLTGRMPQRVTCSGEAWLSPNVADTTLSHFDFGDKLQAHIFVSWLHPYKDHKMVVVGDSGMIVFNDTLPEDDKVVRYPHSAGWDGQLPVLEKATALPVPYGREEPLREEMRHFLDCCESGARPRSDSQEGTNVLHLLDACQQALDSRQAVMIESGDTA